MTVTPEAVTVTAAANSKTYDGTTSAAASPTVTSGTLYDAAVLSESYASMHAGAGLTPTPTASLTNAGNYLLTLVDRTDGVISPRSISAIRACSPGRFIDPPEKPPSSYMVVIAVQPSPACEST